jgi:hypothetical protein
VKMHTVSLSLLVLCLTMVAAPATAQEPCQFDCTIYDNGPVNGEVNALLINFGSAVTNSFYDISALYVINNLSFAVWLSPGDSIQSVDVSVGSTPFGSDVWSRRTLSVSGGGGCFTNGYDYSVCVVSVEPLFQVNGNLWLTLQNAQSSGGNPIYWDQNAGVGCMSEGCPSKALQNLLGYPLPAAAALVPSEAFTMMGNQLDSK